MWAVGLGNTRVRAENLSGHCFCGVSLVLELSGEAWVRVGGKEGAKVGLERDECAKCVLHYSDCCCWYLWAEEDRQAVVLPPCLHSSAGAPFVAIMAKGAQKRPCLPAFSRLARMLPQMSGLDSIICMPNRLPAHSPQQSGVRGLDDAC